jgi:Flp pilus assembly protein TadD
MGVLYLRRGKNQEAEAELQRTCKDHPANGPAHYYLGEALNRLGRVDEALSVLVRATRLSPENPRVFYLLGILYDRRNLPEEAAVMYRRAREQPTIRAIPAH